MTAEQQEKVREALADYELELSTRLYEYGQITGDDHRKDILKDIQSNESGSDEEQQGFNQYIASYESDISKKEAEMALLDVHQYAERSEIASAILSEYKNELIAIEAMGQKGS